MNFLTLLILGKCSMELNASTVASTTALAIIVERFFQTKVTGIRLRDLHIITVGNSPQCEGFPNYLFWVIGYQKS